MKRHTHTHLDACGNRRQIHSRSLTWSWEDKASARACQPTVEEAKLQKTREIATNSTLQPNPKKTFLTIGCMNDVVVALHRTKAKVLLFFGRYRIETYWVTGWWSLAAASVSGMRWCGRAGNGTCGTEAARQSPPGPTRSIWWSRRDRRRARSGTTVTVLFSAPGRTVSRWWTVEWGKRGER